MKRGLGVVLALVLVAGVVLAVVFGGRLGGSGDAPAPPAAGTGSAGPTKQVTGVVGSEKEAFFRDPRVMQAFAAHGLTVQVTSAGSRDIARRTDLDKADFAFPSSAPAADAVRTNLPGARSYTPFFSPMAIATFAPIADLLTKAGVVRKDASGAQVFDVAKYEALAAKKTRWDQLPGNTTYPAGKSVLVTTTDVRRSNSAAMYLALASYVANGRNVVSSSAQVDAVLPTVTPLFLDLGYSGGSSEGPFEDYLSAGVGKTPMVLVYESQFLDRQMRKDGTISDDMRLLYPTPDVHSTHTLLANTPAGDEVGRLLTSDPTFMQLEATFGFRPQQRAVFKDTLSKAGVTPPPELVDVIQPPSFGVLEQLIGGIEKAYG